MKTWMFYVFSVVLIITMGIILYHDQPMISPQLLSVDREYHLISGRDDTIDIPLYVNVEHHDFLDIDQHIGSYLSNQQGTKKMDIHLTGIAVGTQEYYLDMLWTEWIFVYELSVVGYDYEIQDLYLDVMLENGDAYQIKLGRLSILSVTETKEHLDWHALSARKATGSLFSRIETIDIEFNHLHAHISSITIGFHDNCPFVIVDQHLKITIREAHFLLNRVPIIIDFQDGEVQIIDNFTYIIDHQVLKESGMLVTTYALY
jgi:hypothetical protein